MRLWSKNECKFILILYMKKMSTKMIIFIVFDFFFSKFQFRIVGGERAKMNQYPFMAAIMKYGNKPLLKGGATISELSHFCCGDVRIFSISLFFFG